MSRLEDDVGRLLNHSISFRITANSKVETFKISICSTGAENQISNRGDVKIVYFDTNACETRVDSPFTDIENTSYINLTQQLSTRR